nr:immunoglobulin heavy chain junction region [Mus musculus]
IVQDTMITVVTLTT